MKRYWSTSDGPAVLEVFFTVAGLGYHMFNDTLKRRFGGKWITASATTDARPPNTASWLWEP